MNDREFNILAEAAIKQIEAGLEASGADLDFAQVSAGVLEIELADRSKIIVNRHAAAQEMWVAARSGGFHFRWDGAAWRDTRTGGELMADLSALISAQAGEAIDLGG
jgi:CyaY protein